MTKLDDMCQRLRDQLTDREREVLDERLKRPIAPDSKLDPKLEPTSKPDRIAREMAHAREAFEKHGIVETGQGRWLVREPGTSTFWFEVVILAGGSMIVHGDIQAVIFGHYRPAQDTPESVVAAQIVRWMASRKRPDDGYFIEKAGIGGTADETIWTYDEDTLRAEITELIKEASEGEFGEDGRLDDRREELEDILGRVGVVSLEQIQQEVIAALAGDYESVPRGQIISSAMVHAHAALQRLMKLLDEARDEVPWC